MEKMREGESQKREDAGASKGRKVAKHCVFSKHTMLGALLEVEMWKKRTPMWREAHLKVKSVKTRQVRSTFGS